MVNICFVITLKLYHKSGVNGYATRDHPKIAAIVLQSHLQGESIWVLRYVIRRHGAFPIKRNGIGIGAIRHAIRLLQNTEIVGIFPEGTRNRSIYRIPAKPGIGFIASKIDRITIVPIAISFHPFRVLKRNAIYIGKPISIPEPCRKDYRGLSNHIMQTIHALKTPKEPSYIK
jgi:1-acyl-sn-glycerol-3-phosphate acyltransferase